MNSSHMMRVFVLASLAALAPFAIDTYLPAFHVMTNDLETTPHAIQQSLTFYLFPYALMTLFHGAISDAIGRIDRKSTRLNSSHIPLSRMPSSA